MEVGILFVELAIGEASSLKEKRKILKSLITRLKNKFNLSVAEVGAQNKWQKAELGIAVVGNDKSYLNRIMEKTIDKIEENGDMYLVEYQVHFW